LLGARCVEGFEAKLLLYGQLPVWMQFIRDMLQIIQLGLGYSEKTERNSNSCGLLKKVTGTGCLLLQWILTDLFILFFGTGLLLLVVLAVLKSVHGITRSIVKSLLLIEQVPKSI
jgi:hypothetical protein